MNIKEIKITAYSNHNQQNPVDVLLLDWLTTDKYKDRVEAIRAEPDENIQKKMKSKIPCCTASGTFKNKTELIQASGFIAIDVDAKDNPDFSPTELKTKISKIANVFYCAYSVRGRGVWGLIPLYDTNRFVDHFRALEIVFNEIGIVLDDACSNINRLRYCSYDPEPYFNYDAIPFDLVYMEPPKPPKSLVNKKKFNNDTESIFERFNRHCSILTILENNGWQSLRAKGDIIPISRPGVSGVKSADYHKNDNYLIVYTSSTALTPYSKNGKKAYTASEIFCILECGGDWTLTGKRLKELNY